MNKPFVYVRSSSKGHGLGNQIEGVIKQGQKVLVIEDLISTGGSSLKAVDALRDAGCEVIGMIAIFTYQFDLAVENFKNKAIRCETLSNYHTLLETAKNAGYVKENDIETLKEWRQDPANWKK